MGFHTRILLVAALSGAAPVAATATPNTRLELEVGAVGLMMPGDWIIDADDNVCGLKDARQIRKPAVVDYDSLISATAEMKEMKRKGIKKGSPAGQVLYSKAVDRVRSAASEFMKDKGYDSIWKEIKHRKGKRASDVTSAVKKLVEKIKTRLGARD